MAADVHRPAAEQGGGTIRQEIPPGLPDVFVDPDRMQLVFSNLLTNALRFAPRESDVVVRARVETAATDVDSHRVGGGDRVRFEIADRGPGISRAHQQGLFEKFARVPGSPEGGSGLGLYIAKSVVEAHGGEIGIDSEAGEGATFWFTIPVAPASSTSAEP
jgi:signal transduction histidine kinase